MKKELVKYTMKFSKRLIVYYANILNVNWKNGCIYSVKVKSYINLKRDYYDNFEFKLPFIPKEIIEFILINESKFKGIN